MKTTDLATCCPQCGTEMDAVTNALGEKAPKPGNITICAYCFEPCRFDDQMKMQKFDLNELPPVFREQLKKIIASAKTGVNLN